MATRLLKSLLEKGLVEGVVAVAPTGRPGRLFAPALLRRPEEVEAAAGSKYYPVEFSGVLRELRSAPGRYALVGLPCVIAALRRAQRELPWVAARLRYLVGLVCGQGVSAHYTTALGYLSGLRGAGPVAVNYRSKENTRLASDFDFIASGGDERQGRALPWTAGPERIWREQLLALPGCFWCADPFAAEADISLMDAWLPAYAADPRGASLLVVRSAELDSLLEEERARGRAALSPLEEAEVLRAQAGALARRRRLLSVGRARGGKRLLLRLLLGRRRGRAYLWRRALGMRGVGKRLGLGAFSLYLAFLRGSEAMGRRLSGARLGKRLSFISSEGRFDREKRNDLSAGRTCRLP
jgi:coenzyme F420-reducing hydrogenase beta subunit